MFFVHTPGGFLMDAEAVSCLTGHSLRTIRKHCVVVEHRGRFALYNAEHCGIMLEGVKPRPERQKAA